MPPLSRVAYAKAEPAVRLCVPCSSRIRKSQRFVQGNRKAGVKLTRVRFANPQDATCLAKMNSVFNRQLMDAKTIRKKIRSGLELVLVAEIDDHIAGFACAQFFDSFCYANPYAELTELFVEATHRRRGIAVALVRQMEEELAKRGASHIHILTGARNGPARALYERLGYFHNRKRPEILYDKNMKPKGPPIAK